MVDDLSKQAGLSLWSEHELLVLEFTGGWRLMLDRPDCVAVLESAHEQHPACQVLCFRQGRLRAWDSSLLLFLRQACDWADLRGLRSDLSQLPLGVQNLMAMASAVPAVAIRAGAEPARDLLSRIGRATVAGQQKNGKFIEFIGQLTLDCAAFTRGRAQYRGKDFVVLLQETGPQALLIVSLLSFLTGLIIAFIGVIQLQKFAADLYVADLVGLAITRELGALMVGIIMAGRTGAAFAAQIGSMQVNEELDALTSFGISPTQLLVLPRIFALVFMMPLLCVCANLLGMLGGMLVAVVLSEVSVLQYVNELQYAVGLNDFFGGVFKSAVFGLIIAIAGCYRGLNCGRDASSVGLAATSAVVAAITGIVIADAIFALLFNRLGI
jgi:phospholipid/cholesterol/gamma-HCH transport system permease protein